MFHRIRTAWRIYRVSLSDRRTPLAAKVLPWMGLLYLIVPLDIIPDVLPVLGQLDDIGIIILLFLWALRLIPEEVKKKAKREDVIDVEAK